MVGGDWCRDLSAKLPIKNQGTGEQTPPISLWLPIHIIPASIEQHLLAQFRSSPTSVGIGSQEKEYAMKVIGGIFILLVLACMVLGVAGVGMYGANYIIDQFSGFGSIDATYTALALCTAIACTLIVSNVIKSSNSSNRGLIFIQKTKAYEQLLREVAYQDPAHTIPETVTHQLLLYGSSSAIREYAALCAKRAKGETEVEALYRLIKEIRSDLRSVNIGLNDRVMHNILAR
jgi:HAMP domain-containing protein